PGPYYPALDVLYPGTRITLIGQHPVYYFYWLARTEDGLECWVPRRWTDAPPDAAERLPRVPEVPPPPPGAFVVVRYRPVFMVPFCPEFFGPALQFTVKNLGPEPIRSMEMWIEVLETGAVYHTVREEGVPTCLKTRTQIPSRARADIVARTKVDLTEKPILITIKACTQPYFRGACVQYTMRWTVPKPPVYPMVRP
ncbi:MAG: hypothetical protein GXO36_01320, partial [Chloroflexi bacterium]|nr:hypothetical protein [Chloroflexota bacterium]